jgi:hypothetical protein
MMEIQSIMMVARIVRLRKVGTVKPRKEALLNVSQFVGMGYKLETNNVMMEIPLAETVVLNV